MNLARIKAWIADHFPEAADFMSDDDDVVEPPVACAALSSYGGACTEALGHLGRHYAQQTWGLVSWPSDKED